MFTAVAVTEVLSHLTALYISPRTAMLHSLHDDEEETPHGKEAAGHVPPVHGFAQHKNEVLFDLLPFSSQRPKRQEECHRDTGRLQRETLHSCLRMKEDE